LSSNKKNYKIKKRFVVLSFLFLLSTILLMTLVIQRTFYPVKKLNIITPIEKPVEASTQPDETPDLSERIADTSQTGIKYPSLAIVIDDFGHQWNTVPVQGLLEIEIPMTVAILPGLWASDSIATKAYNLGKEIIVHLPMEAVNHDYNLEKRFLRDDMTELEAIRFLDETCNIKNASGLNNHMGSLSSQNSILMVSLAEWCKKRGWFLFDSITHPSSVLYEEAINAGIPAIKRDIFLDHNIDQVEIVKALHNAVSISERKQRVVVVIGHPRASTWEILKKEIPELKSNGVQFVTLSQALADR
jgi:uncharacterized protein